MIRALRSPPRLRHLAALVPLLASTACASQPYCLYVGPDDEFPNHVQPFQVALDVVQRMGYSTAFGSRSLAVFDLDTAELTAMLPLAEQPLSYPDVAVDDQGVAWISIRGEPAAMRLDLASGEITELGGHLQRANTVLPVPGGGAVYLGFTPDDPQRSALARFAADGSPEDLVELTGGAAGVVQLSGDRIATVSRAGLPDGFQVRQLPELDVVQTCDLPFLAERGAELDDGRVIVAGLDRIGLVDCGDGEPGTWTVGTENHEVIGLGTQALVLDRIGAGEFDPNMGMALRVDGDGPVPDSTFGTGKNTGYGGFDPITGTVWANSEGTSEVWGFDPWDGTVHARIPTGVFIDGLALDREVDDAAFVTGRLSNTIARIEDGEVTAEHGDVFWPFSPVVDLGRDRLWVLSHTETVIHGLSRAGLQPEQVIDPGMGRSVLLTFSSLLLHPARDTLFLADAERDQLLEIDPDSGATLATWDLGGPLIEDRDAKGQLLLRLHGDSGAVIVSRSNDARVQRVDPDGGVDTIWLGDDLAEQLTSGNAVEFATLLQDDDLLYLGGLALDPTTLERLEEHDLDVYRVIGPHPRRRSHLLAVHSDREQLVRLDARGEPIAAIGFSNKELHAAIYRIDQDTSAIVMSRAMDGLVCWFRFEDMN